MFLGSKNAGLLACTRLAEQLPKGTLKAIVCPDDSKDVRSVMPQFETLCASVGVPFHIAATRQATLDLLQKYQPKVVIVHGWYTIIPVDDFPGVLFLGFHYSPLPRYRGNAPLVWQIIRGEPSIGVSFFELTREMDAGRLVAQKTAPLGPDDSIGTALMIADNLVRAMIDEFVPALVNGALTLTNQPDEQPSYCGLRTPDDGRIDWRWSAKRIHDFVRAQSLPYPGAYTELADGRRLTVWKTALENRVFMGVPGGVAEIARPDVVVTTAEGAIRLQIVQVEGGEPMAAANILSSLRTRLV